MQVKRRATGTVSSHCISSQLPLTNRNKVQKRFVQVVRAVELALGIRLPGYETDYKQLPFSTNITVSFDTIRNQNIFDPEVATVLVESIPIILRIAAEFRLSPIFGFSRKPGFKSEPLFTK